MKTFLILVLSSVVTLAQAKTIDSSEVVIKPSEIQKVVRSLDKKTPGSSEESLQVVVTGGTMSTDVSPRYQIYVGYASNAEMGNISANFLISDKAFTFKSAKALSATSFEVKTTEYRDEGMFDVTLVIDAKQVLLDEKAMRKSCDNDFCDGTLKSTVQVTETARLQ